MKAIHYMRRINVRESSYERAGPTDPHVLGIISQVPTCSVASHKSPSAGDHLA